MNYELMMGIINNVILLLALGIIYSFLPSAEINAKKTIRIRHSIFIGISLSVIIVLVMLSSFELSEGVTLDTRSIFISMTALFFGFIPAAMVIISASIVRVLQGGVGAFPGILVIVSSGVIGVIFRKFRYHKIKDRKVYRLFEVLLFGVIVHVAMLIMFLALPKDSRIEIIKNIYPYVLTIYPITTVVFASFMFQRYEWVKNSIILSETKQNFSKVVETAPVPIILHTEDGEILSISNTLKEISGYSHSDIPTIKAWNEYAFGENQKEFKEFIDNLFIVKEKRYNGEFPVKSKDGNTLLWDFYSTHIGKLPDGRKMTMSVALDVTKRAELLADLMSEKQLLETTLLSVGDGVIVTDIKGNLSMMNNVAETLTGWNKQDAIGLDIEEVFNIVSDSTGEKCSNIIHKVVKLGISQELANHTNLISKDGTIRPIADSAAPIVEVNGEIVGVIIVFRDYSEKYNEAIKINNLVEELQKTEILLESTFDSVKDIIIISLDKEYRYLYFNNTHRKDMLHAYNTNISIGDCVFDFMTSQDDISRIKKNYDIALSGESHTTLEKYGDLEINYYETKFNPIYDTQGNIYGLTVFSENVTDTVKMQNTIRENEKSYRHLSDNSPLSMVQYMVVRDEKQKTMEFKMLTVNKKYEDLVKKKSAELIGKCISEVFPKTEQYWIDVFEKVADTGETIIFENYTAEFDHYLRIYVYRTEIDKIAYLIEDVTENRLITNELKKNEEKYRKMSENLLTTQEIAKIKNWEMNLDMDEIKANAKDLKLHDINGSDGIVEASTIINRIYEKDREMVQKALDELVLNKKPFNIFFRLNTINEKHKYINSRAFLDVDENNVPVKIVGMNQDITELKEKELELEYLAYNDFLTGLKNRRYFEKKIKELDVKENYPLTIIMSDINGLKLINDAFGHVEGDELLISAANLILSNCRDTDIVARIGGDEFVIVMPNTSEEMAEKVVKDINSKAKEIRIQSIPLSISFGYKSKQFIEQDIQEVFRSAEDLMYREKLLIIPSMRSGAIETILKTLYEKDAESEIHSRRVSQLSERLAGFYGMNRQDVAEVKTAGLLHDIGKIIIPLPIINKAGKLLKDEYEVIKNHPEIGFRILNSTQDMREVSNIVLNHHERWDGKGYPRGIKEEAIPTKSRIISIADAFDAMTSERSYRATISNEEALLEIVKCSGTQFDPGLVKIFEKYFVDISAE